MDRIELSIVMPCLNEARTLPVCVEKAQRYLRESGVSGEIIVADNGSTDGSIEIAERLGARVVPVPIKGYGAALSEGIFEARGEFVIMGDSDDSYDFLRLQPFVDKLREGFDLVMGNRFQGGISPGAMPFMHRFVGNPMLSALGRRIYDHDVCGDFYCGLRGFRRDAIQHLRIQSTGMEFALEMIIKAELNALKITEVPTTLSPDGRDRKPHLKTYRDGWRSLRLYLLMSPRWTFGVPGLLLVISGSLGFIAGWPGIFGATTSLVILPLAAACVVCGFQALLLAVFAKFVAIESGLHPPATRFFKLQERGTLENFLIAGGAIVLTSLVFGISAVIESFRLTDQNWPNAVFFGFAAATALCVGSQTILAGLYFGLLHLLTERRRFRRKRREDLDLPVPEKRSTPLAH
ncbi:MAG: glycosyltransferase family 2 protein [Terrimicrobiaceae bacterium]|nr:glycosyltransferase family 2 protein [Terrimicrobiaceae bacterium]